MRLTFRFRRPLVGLVECALAAFLAVPPTLAQGLPPVPLDPLGLSAERIGRISEAFQQRIDDGELSGAVTMIVRKGQVAHFEAHGWRDREAGDRMQRDDIFAIASMTKPVTSVAVMMLFEEGRFLLDEPVSRTLPELAELRVAVVDAEAENVVGTRPAKRPITIRDLLRHTSGFTYGFIDDGPVGVLYREAQLLDDERPLAELVANLAKLPLVFEPGTAWEYGVSTDVLGYLVEKVSGQPFERFLSERIFAPLAMRDTGFYVPEEDRDRLVAHYAPVDGKLVQAPRFRDYMKPPVAPSGGGGLVSTAADYARFVQMLVNGGELDGVRLLSRKSIELMTADHLHGLEGRGPGRSFGLGFGIRSAAGTELPGSVGSYYWNGIYNTFFWVDPSEDLFAICLTQMSPYGHLDLGDRFRVLTYQAIVD